MKKFILTASLVGIGALALYADKKKASVQKLLDNLKPKIDSISNVKIRNSSLLADIVIGLANPTAESISLSGLGVAKITGVILYDSKGKEIGNGVTNLEAIDILPNSVASLPTVNASVPLSSAAQLLLSGNTKDIKPVIEVMILGKKYSIQ